MGSETVVNAANAGSSASLSPNVQDDSLEDNARNMNETEILIKQLRDLKRPFGSAERCCELIEEILLALFEVEVTNTKLDEDDLKVIGPLLANVVQVLFVWFELTLDDFRMRYKRMFQKERSGLEFLIRKYKDLSDGEGGCVWGRDEELQYDVYVEYWDNDFQLSYGHPAPSPNRKQSDLTTLTAEAAEQEYFDKDFLLHYDHLASSLNRKPSNLTTLTAEAAEQVPTSHWWWWVDTEDS